VFIFSESKLTPVRLREDVVLWGLAHLGPSFRKNPLENFRVPDEKTHILLLHGSDMSNVPGGKATHAPFFPDDIRQAGFAFALLGHYHQGRISPEKKPILAYPGSPEPLALCSSGLHGAVVLEVDGSKVNIRAVPTATYRSVRKEVDVSDQTHLEAIARKIAGALEKEAGEKVLAQVSLVGTRHPDVNWDLNALRDALPQGFLHIYLEDRTLPGFPLEELREEKTVRGEFVRRLLAEMEEATGEQRELLQSALTAGLLAFEKKPVNQG
jgi:DNA repair exonuclease SbcCD nuclease subunit